MLKICSKYFAGGFSVNAALLEMCGCGLLLPAVFDLCTLMTESGIHDKLAYLIHKVYADCSGTLFVRPVITGLFKT